MKKEDERQRAGQKLILTGKLGKDSLESFEDGVSGQGGTQAKTPRELQVWCVQGTGRSRQVEWSEQGEWAVAG